MKTKKNKRSKLGMLSLLLFLSIVLLSTSTYAWFTSNRTVKIEDIDVHVETSGGLQISVDAVNWKTVITNEDITSNAYTGNINQFPGTIVPTSSAMAVDATGKLAMFKASVGTGTDGEFNFTATKETDTAGTTGAYVAFDIFLKNESSGTSDTGQIYLTSASDVTKEDDSDDNGLKNAARVAFVIQGNSSNLNDTAANYIALAPTAATTDGTNVILWEPNYNTHTDAGAASATYYFDQSTAPATDGTASAITYLGVNQAITTAIPLRYSLQSSTERSTYFTSIDTTTLSNLRYIKTKADGTDRTNQLVMTKLGVTKVRIYLWIEGQDVDCENNASGTDITYSISLTKNDSADE